MTAVRVTEPGIKTIKSPKLAEFLLFQAILALQYLPYRGCRIVMDQNRKNSPKERKSANVRIKKRLLSLAPIEPHEVLARILAPDAEKLQPNFVTGDDRDCATPIHFGLMSCFRLAWNKGVGLVHPELHLGKPHIPANRRFAP